mmetsp:Transcript_30646/g.66896  ORF Transcript_30646/g.66896 Transcript_30646/m.66896 type:complete len:369 (-) Transcript_30646:124-1230(-)
MRGRSLLLGAVGAIGAIGAIQVIGASNGGNVAVPSQRAAFLNILTYDNARHPVRSPVHAVKLGERTEGKYRTASWSFQSEPGVPNVVVDATRLEGSRETSGPAKVLVWLHGTGDSATSTGTQQQARELLASTSYDVVLTLDSRFHGVRRKYSIHAFDLNSDYQQALVAAFVDRPSVNKYPFIYDTVYDLLRLLTFLESQARLFEDDGITIDFENVGIGGISLGAMHSLYAGLASPRFTTLSLLIGVQDFARAVADETYGARIDTIRGVFEAAAGNEGITPNTVAEVWRVITPGILDFELGTLLRDLGREKKGVYIGNGGKDPRNPIGYVRDAAESADVTLVIDEDAAHQVTPLLWKRMLDFLSNPAQC